MVYILHIFDNLRFSFSLYILTKRRAKKKKKIEEKKEVTTQFSISMGKKRECAMRYRFYVIQTIICEKNTLRWWMLDNDQNRIDMSSENPLSSRAFQIGLTILHYYWGQVHLGSQQWFDGTMSCFLFPVFLPNRCPSLMVKIKYSSSTFCQVPVSVPWE